MYKRVEEFRIGQLDEAVSETGVTDGSPLIKVHQIQDATEALEINEGDSNMLSLHYTLPSKEVLFSASPSGSLYEDVGSETFGDDFDSAQSSMAFGGD